MQREHGFIQLTSLCGKAGGTPAVRSKGERRLIIVGSDYSKLSTQVDRGRPRPLPPVISFTRSCRFVGMQREYGFIELTSLCGSGRDARGPKNVSVV